MRFEFEVGDLVDCLMHDRGMIRAVIIGKENRPIISPTGESGEIKTIYKIHRADGKVLKLHNGIYPIGQYKDEV